jgi:hypothetical protein
MPSEVVNTSASPRPARFVDDPQHHLVAVHARVIERHAVFGTEGGGERTHRLIDDQRRVEDDAAFLFRRGNERGTDFGGMRGVANERSKHESGEKNPKCRRTKCEDVH